VEHLEHENPRRALRGTQQIIKKVISELDGASLYSLK
jgi:hypothetical protein